MEFAIRHIQHTYISIYYVPSSKSRQNILGFGHYLTLGGICKLCGSFFGVFYHKKFSPGSTFPTHLSIKSQKLYSFQQIKLLVLYTVINLHMTVSTLYHMWTINYFYPILHQHYFYLDSLTKTFEIFFYIINIPTTKLLLGGFQILRKHIFRDFWKEKQIRMWCSKVQDQ